MKRYTTLTKNFFRQLARGEQVAYHEYVVSATEEKIIVRGLSRDREVERLSTYGYGITDIAKKPTSRAKDLTENDYNLGQVILREKIRSYNPKVVAFIYKKAAEKLLGRSFRNQFGLLQERIENAKVFLFPAPYAPEKDESKYMTDLKRLIDSIGQ